MLSSVNFIIKGFATMDLLPSILLLLAPPIDFHWLLIPAESIEPVRGVFLRPQTIEIDLNSNSFSALIPRGQPPDVACLRVELAAWHHACPSR